MFQTGPVARMTWTNQMSVEAIKSLIESNKYLVLPRVSDYSDIIFILFSQLSSQSHMDDLCPVSSRNPRKLCAIMLVSERASESKHVSTLRDFVQTHRKQYSAERIRFAYMFADRQKEFMREFQPKLLTDHDDTTKVIELSLFLTSNNELMSYRTVVILSSFGVSNSRRCAMHGCAPYGMAMMISLIKVVMN